MMERIQVVFHLDDSEPYSSLVHDRLRQSVRTAGRVRSARLEAMLEPGERAFGSDVLARELLYEGGLARFRAYLDSLRALGVIGIMAAEPGSCLQRSVPVSVVREISVTRTWLRSVSAPLR